MTPEPLAPTLMPKLSVIVANFNGAAHLDACLRSLTRQSLSNLEIIVVDDGSTDDSVARLSQWAARDRRVVALTNRGAKGPAGARNTGLAAARGEWIGIVDSDDLVFARRFESLRRSPPSTSSSPRPTLPPTISSSFTTMTGAHTVF